MNRKPYDPALSGPQIQIHDRRAREVNRGSRAHVVETEIDDPYEPGARITAVRSVRDDPLADHLARGHIDQAQFEAGRAFQRYFAVAERGPRAMQLAEAVDGSPFYQGLTDEQLMAGKWLTRCYGALGKDGSVLMHDILVQNRTFRQVAVSRGQGGQEWDRFLSRFFFECLDTLAIVFGFSNGARDA